MRNMRQITLSNVHGKPVVQVPAHQREDIQYYLASEGINATYIWKPASLFDTLQLEGNVDLLDVDVALKRWTAGQELRSLAVA